ncbi:MAG: transcription antitermination factor NusB [Gammaproteobacteria bacterium]|nr:MAG: transcription antitermination factor NusB [Gammaproteobacteria bacterium]
MISNDKQASKKRSLAQQANVARARARRFAMQAVYQHLLTGDDYAEISKQVAEREANKNYDTFFFSDIIEGVADYGNHFDMQLAPFANRPMVQLDIVEHAILLVAAYELNSGITPPKVAINEAIIIAKKFASDDSHKFVNGVLDKLYKSLTEKKPRQ